MQIAKTNNLHARNRKRKAKIAEHRTRGGVEVEGAEVPGFLHGELALA